MKTLMFLCCIGVYLHADMTTRMQVMMGTFVSVTLPERHASYIQKSFELAETIEKALSSYKKGADIYRLNHERKVRIGSYTYEALRLSAKYYRESGGYFDIAVGSITKTLYRFGEGSEHVPSTSQLEATNVSFEGVHFNSKAAWLERGIVVDLGGMGKGFAADRMADALHRQGIDKGIVALSGDIRCLDICRIAVKNPFGTGIVASFETKKPDTAVSTSGNYRRYIGNPTNNHLIDPKRRRPQRSFASITLLSWGDNTKIDAYATAASVMPFQQAKTFLDNKEVGYILVTADRNIYTSGNLSKYTQHLRFEQFSKQPEEQYDSQYLQTDKCGDLDDDE